MTQPRYAATLITPPLLQVVSVSEAKSHARLDIDAEDGLVNGWINAATKQVEADTGMKLLTQTWDIKTDWFPFNTEDLDLPFGPLQSVTYVKYYDSSAVLQTMSSANYIVDTVSIPARLGLVDGASWPSDIRRFQPGVVRGVFGYATAADVPENLVQAVCLLVGHYYLNREAVGVGVGIGAIEVPFGYEALIPRRYVTA